jgi:ABC-type multidrug transport system fused ATPase/permease subunit
VGRLVTRVTGDVEALNELFTAGVVAGLGDLFTLLAISVMMLVVDWRLALAAFAVIPFVVLVSRRFQRRVRVQYRDIRTRVARINSFVQERLAGLRVVQLFGRERASARASTRSTGAPRVAAQEHHGLRALLPGHRGPHHRRAREPARRAAGRAGRGRGAPGALTVGTVAAFLQLVRRFFQPLQDLSEKFNILQAAMAASERIFGLLDTPPEAPPRRPAADRAAALAPRSAAAGVTVEFDDVWFAYDLAHQAVGAPAPEQPEWVLRGVSFRAEPGQTLALVGHTGAGKSTIVALLLRFYVPQRGRVLLDGVDVRDLTPEEVRARVGYVQQDIFLFAGTVGDNIRLSAPLADADLDAAAARVGADRVVARLPGGWRPRAGRARRHALGGRAAAPELRPRHRRRPGAARARRGHERGGQRGRGAHPAGARLAHARAHDGGHRAPAVHRGRRRPDPRAAPRRVAERGRHRDLLARGGLYARLYRLQSVDAPDAPDARPAPAAA